MSDLSSDPRRDVGRGGPRRVIASFETYPDAEAAVDRLSDRKFPVERVSVVGRDLQMVEHVLGRMTLPRAILNGALSGALVGLLIGWLFTVFDWTDPLVARGWLILDGLWFGALVGALFGLLSHLLTRGRRDFTSVGAVQADHYDLVVDDAVADEAARLLGIRAGDEPRFTREAPWTGTRATASEPRGGARDTRR
jgi:hypothetical protein